MTSPWATLTRPVPPSGLRRDGVKEVDIFPLLPESQEDT